MNSADLHAAPRAVGAAVGWAESATWHRTVGRACSQTVIGPGLRLGAHCRRSGRRSGHAGGACERRSSGCYACLASTEKGRGHVSVGAMTGRCGHAWHLARLSDTWSRCRQGFRRAGARCPLDARLRDEVVAGCSSRRSRPEIAGGNCSRGGAAHWGWLAGAVGYRDHRRVLAARRAGCAYVPGRHLVGPQVPAGTLVEQP